MGRGGRARARGRLAQALRSPRVHPGPAKLGRGPPLGPPLRRLPTLGDVDRLTRDLVAPELEDADPEVPRPVVVADQDLHDPEVGPAPDLAELDLRGRRVVAPPLAEVLDSLEALTGLRKLENRIGVIGPVSGVGIAGEELLDHRLDGRRVHAHSLPKPRRARYPVLAC